MKKLLSNYLMLHSYPWIRDACTKPPNPPCSLPLIVTLRRVVKGQREPKLAPDWFIKPTESAMLDIAIINPASVASCVLTVALFYSAATSQGVSEGWRQCDSDIHLLQQRGQAGAEWQRHQHHCQYGPSTVKLCYFVCNNSAVIVHFWYSLRGDPGVPD